jgi:hypothetical protein
MLDHARPEERDDKPFIWSSLWTAARGEQLINCELIVAGTGKATLRCGFGPGAVIRSQIMPSASAAAEVSESWKSALVAQGFRVAPRMSLSLSPTAVRAASATDDWSYAGAGMPVSATKAPDDLATDTAVQRAAGSAGRTRASS